MISRRTLLAALAAFGFTGMKAFGAPQDPADSKKPFSFDALTDWANFLSGQPFQEVIPAKVDEYSYDGDFANEIKFKSDLAILVGDYPVQMFHQGLYHAKPVRIFIIGAKGVAEEVRYDPNYFEYGKWGFVRSKSTGFAGFKVMEALGDEKTDWLSFLGACYFKALGQTRQFGLSARGLAIDVGTNPEEFPFFKAFWLEPRTEGGGIVVNALLDSPSITGAYRMEAIRGDGVTMIVDARLFPRREIERIGIAPLTSMFWYGKHNRKMGFDWRPEVHDSDGLAIWTGGGERIWRPLNNPPQPAERQRAKVVKTSTFDDGKQPRGFGLLQREYRFSGYEDHGTRYDQRPSAWVKLKGGWVEGSVQLVETHTDNETEDNINAYWVPKKPLEVGHRRDFSYEIHWRWWQLDSPYAPRCGIVSATWLGAAAGEPGAVQYVVDFKGGKLQQLSENEGVKLDLTAKPPGSILGTTSYPVKIDGIEPDRFWRASFVFKAASSDPTELRLYLKNDSETLTETWLFQHLPSLETSPL